MANMDTHTNAHVHMHAMLAMLFYIPCTNNSGTVSCSLTCQNWNWNVDMTG